MTYSFKYNVEKRQLIKINLQLFKYINQQRYFKEMVQFIFHEVLLDQPEIEEVRNFI